MVETNCVGIHGNFWWNFMIFSVGGSLISTPAGFDNDFISKFKKVIQKEVEKNDQGFIIVCGGGHKARDDQKAYKEKNPKATNSELDKIGIEATRINALYMAKIFGDIAKQRIIKNPVREIITDKPVIFAGGWKPGCSTDKVAVLLAKNVGAERVINLTNTDGIYNRDPNGKNGRSAKLIKRISWNHYRAMIPREWTPGLSTPFDPKASKLADKKDMEVIILNGRNLKNLKSYFKGKGQRHFKGTTISCEKPSPNLDVIRLSLGQDLKRASRRIRDERQTFISE